MNKNDLEVFQPEIKIKKVCFENFRGFEKFELDLQPTLTVFIGQNGTGKTAILEGIAKLLMVFENQIRGEISRDFKELTTLFDSLDIKKGTVKSSQSLFLSLDDNELKCEVFFGKKSRPILGETHFEGLNEFSERFYRQALSHLPLMVYYPASQAPVNTIDFKNAHEDFETDIFTAYDGALDKTAFDLMSFFSWYKWQENIEKQIGDNPVINLVRDAIYNLLSDEHNSFNNLSINWLNNPTGEMRLYKGETPLNINQLSSGEKTLFALVADLVRRLAIANPHRKNPLLGNGVVLIDEVDLHLHPRWQRTLIPQLQKTFPNCQFITTTHSPLVLSQVPRQQVVILDDFKQVKKIPHSFGRDTNSLLYEFMGVSQRPEAIQQKINQCYDLIDQDQLEEAEKCFKKLSTEYLGPNDPDIVQGETLINFMKD